MHTKQTENLLLAENIDVSAIKEVKRGGEYYALVKISLLGRDSYGICILGSGYAFESLGDSIDNAAALFELIVADAPAIEQLFDIVSDFRREKALEE